MGTGSFPGVKYGRGVLLNTHPAVMEEYSYTSTHPLGHNKACNGNTLPLLLPILYRSTCRISREKVGFRYSPIEVIIIVKIITRYREFFDSGIPSKITRQ
jgi:prepilin signal peptidase PulO-like enzyme (type II secretory pathway)